MEKSICEVSINDLSCIELYRVPLVCEAAPQIGCGCRTKPVLTALEHHALVKRAWLRRSGTAVAVQWHQPLPKEDAMRIVNAAFADESTVELVNDGECNELFAELRGGSGWYSAATIDDLSGEEA